MRGWSVRKRPEEERWSGNAIQGMKGTPSRLAPNTPGVDIPIQIRVPEAVGEVEEPPPVRDETGGRRPVLMKADFERHGYQVGCEGCRRLEAGMAQRVHAQTCTNRMEKAMDEENSIRWRTAKVRKEGMRIEKENENEPEAQEQNQETRAVKGGPIRESTVSKKMK